MSLGRFSAMPPEQLKRLASDPACTVSSKPSPTAWEFAKERWAELSFVVLAATSLSLTAYAVVLVFWY